MYLRIRMKAKFRELHFRGRSTLYKIGEFHLSNHFRQPRFGKIQFWLVAKKKIKTHAPRRLEKTIVRGLAVWIFFNLVQRNIVEGDTHEGFCFRRMPKGQITQIVHSEEHGLRACSILYGTHE